MRLQKFLVSRSSSRTKMSDFALLFETSTAYLTVLENFESPTGNARNPDE